MQAVRTASARGSEFDFSTIADENVVWLTNSNPSGSGMSSTIRDFVERLDETDVMPREELQRLVEQHCDGRWDSDPTRLADELVRNGRLSRYQADRLQSHQPLLIDDYVLIDERGAGGMGRVYKARHRRMGRIVALKLIRERQFSSRQAVKRFSREIKAVAALDHPNIVRAYDAGEFDETHYLAMEYIDGEDLFRHVRRNGPLPVAEAVDCVIQAAAGLEYAHESGIIHRDVKPSNLMREPSGKIRLLDLGLARLCLPTELDPEDVTDAATEDGDLLGTAAYMAPEQSENPHEVDHRCDIYALGCTLHFLLTGSSVYGGSSYVDKVLAHRTAEIPRLSSPHGEIPPALQSVFDKMVAKSPEDRFQTMRDVAAALQNAVEPLSTSSPVVDRSKNGGQATDGRRVAMWLAMCAVAGLIVFAFLQFVAQDPAVSVAMTPGETPEETVRTSPDSSDDPVAAPLLTPRELAERIIALGGTIDVPDDVQGLKSVGDAPSLPAGEVRIVRVTLTGARGTDDLLPSVGRLPELDWINLAGSDVTSDGVQSLATCTELKTVYLQGTAVDDAAVGTLVRLPQLSELDLQRTQVSDAGLEQLAQCETLEVLSVGDGQPVTMQGLRHIAGMTWLTSLSVPGTPADDEFVSLLGSHSELTWLNLNRTDVTPASIPKLSSLPSLSNLFLMETQFTTEDIGTLEEMRQGLEISP
ncbi:MAG: hypothetical protein DWQ34_12775 [Planctomycetota bacterium]|nr:MAG: hypothetical protein DWQ34_12775 [Planctomycetota bacterium]REK24109.1 MAG: hypothetical protein DWQ41_13745 [Planctomycetota bacterium]REK38313.1 MAG: hypothetical protein DWQ45_04900 [Planctomycetota bacterium]